MNNLHIENLKLKPNKNVFEEMVIQNLFAISNCIENQLVTPSLVLIYSTIDTMAFLILASKKSDVDRNDFMAWASKYFIPNLPHHIEPIDLYAARCGVVHSSSPESKLNRDGKANKIFYAWGNADKENLVNISNKCNNNQSPTVLHLNELFIALVKGIKCFFDELEADKILYELVINRTNKIFTNISKECVIEIEKLINK